MTVLHNCPSCGTQVNDDESKFCPKCGAKINPIEALSQETSPIKESKKSGKQALILCILFGPLGIHRFYVGKPASGLLALLTGGFLGIWTLMDLIQINQNKFTDKNGLPLILSKNLSPRHRLMLMLGSIAFWLILSLSLLFMVLSYLTGGLIDTANKQLEALRKGNLQDAYSYTSQEYQKAISFAHFQQWLAENPELQNNQSAAFPQRGVTHSPIKTSTNYLNSGFLEGTITTKEGKSVAIKYIFLKENDQWKIVGIFVEH